jgi:protein ImuA
VAELGGRPENLFLVRTANAAEALAAANDILACASVGALLLEISGMPGALDLVASRRLHFTAASSGVTAILLREGAEIVPSAAQARWQVSSASSAAPSAGQEDWGLPSFRAALTRNRLGPTGCWHLTWSPQDECFHSQANPGLVAAALFDRPVAEKRRFAF